MVKCVSFELFGHTVVQILNVVLTIDALYVEVVAACY